MRNNYRITVKSTKNYYDVDFTRYIIRNISCGELEESTWNTGVHKGDRVRIIAGRKNPIGTEGIVKWCGPNKFGWTFNDALTGRTIHCDPSILLTLDNGDEIWTHGDICINISDLGLDGIHEFKDEKECDAWEKETMKNFPNDTENVWLYDHDQVVRAGFTIWGLGSQSWNVYQNKFFENESVVAAVIDDFSTDTYDFVVFSKERKPGNLIKMVSTGTRRDMDDMWRGDTGLGDALKAFDAYVAEAAA